jgi:hypothetical protein
MKQLKNLKGSGPPNPSTTEIVPMVTSACGTALSPCLKSFATIHLLSNYVLSDSRLQKIEEEIAGPYHLFPTGLSKLPSLYIQQSSGYMSILHYIRFRLVQCYKFTTTTKDQAPNTESEQAEPDGQDSVAHPAREELEALKPKQSSRERHRSVLVRALECAGYLGSRL